MSRVNFFIDYKCKGDWLVGDTVLNPNNGMTTGIGTSEQDCLNYCGALNYLETINGITFSLQGACYCNYGMVAANNDTSYKSCFIVPDV